MNKENPMCRLIPLVLFASSVTIPAQTASVSYIDQRTPYSSGSYIKALNAPKIGTTFRVEVPGSWYYFPPQGYSMSTLLLGSRNPQVPVPALSGCLFSSAEVRMSTPGGYTTQTMSFPIPNDPGLIGCTVFAQVYTSGYLDLPIPTWSQGLSRGMRVVIGR